LRAAYLANAKDYDYRIHYADYQQAAKRCPTTPRAFSMPSIDRKKDFGHLKATSVQLSARSAPPPPKPLDLRIHAPAFPQERSPHNQDHAHCLLQRSLYFDTRWQPRAPVQLSLPAFGTLALAQLHSTGPSAGQNLGRIFNASRVQQHTSELCHDITRAPCSLDCTTTPTPLYIESTYTYRRHTSERGPTPHRNAERVFAHQVP
jgi:hypothetical protein